MTIDPCRICGEPARLETQKAPKRLGQSRADDVGVRVCTSSACPSRTGQRRLGSQV